MSAARVILGVLSLWMMASCGSARKATASQTSENTGAAGAQIASSEALSSVSAKDIIKAVKDRNTGTVTALNGKIKATLIQKDQEQSVPLTFRMVRGKGIWLSALFGVAKAMITPKEVSFYSSVNNLYFTGTFEELSDYVGVAVDYEMLERLFLGESLLPLKPGKTSVTYVDDQYRLVPERISALFSWWLDIHPKDYTLTRASLSDSQGRGAVSMAYANYASVAGVWLPGNLSLIAESKNTALKLDLEFKQWEPNNPLSFPYKIPEGLNRIHLAKKAPLSHE